MITSFPDLIIVGGVALLVFGPKRLPELAKALGNGIKEFKKAMEPEEKVVNPPALPPTDAPRISEPLKSEACSEAAP